MEDVSIIGRKTFFISSDADLITEPILERLMSHGYEAYVIADDARCLMKKKVEDIIRMFPGYILYFNVGSKVIGIEWKAYIKDLCARHRIDAKIGIMYKGTSSAEESVQLEGYYLNEARVGIGCLSLAGDDVEIYDRLLEALARA
ncbi:MAG: hypothetical protein IJU95_05490, partial [Treponema sp.]|nr:hypothetical protein [Treponema sp.]